MYGKHIFRYLLITSICIFGCIGTFAQTAPVSGSVELEKADKTREKVVGALVEVYRIDIRTGFPSAKTDSKGEFRFAGMQLGAVYAFSISAPNCSPATFPNVKAGQERLLVTLRPGDGKKLTEEEARQAIAAGGKVSGPSGPGAPPEMSAAEKKARADLEKQNAEIMEKNKNTQAADEIARKSNEAGKEALKAENWDLAIEKFEEGITAVPDFVGSTPILLNGKLVAYKAKGYKAYKEGITNPDLEVRKVKYEEANKSFEAGLVAFQQAMDLIKKADAAVEPADQKFRSAIQSDLYGVAIEIHRLKAVGGVDYTKGAEALALITAYLAVEVDPVKKLSAQKVLGDIMRMTGDFEKAVAAYKEVLVAKPDDPESLAKLGLSLVAQGAAATPEDKVKEQEGLNYMQKYTEVAPITAADSQSDKELKQSVKETVDYLKSQKMAPQKLPPAPKKKP